MSLQEKLRRYAAETPGIAYAAEGPLTAARLVDFHAQARAANAPITVLHEGAPTDVARRMAARFGITLVDAATIHDGEPHAALPIAAPAAFPLAAPEPNPHPVIAPLLLLAPHEALPTAPAPPVGPAPLPLPPALRISAPRVPRLRLAEIPLLAPPAAIQEPLCVGLPWDASSPGEAPVAPAEVAAFELAALPWHAHAPLAEHTEVFESPVTRRRAPLDHPTTDLHPHGASWGLPWPRPVPAMDAVSKSDPKVWNMPGRIQSMRDDLESRMSGPGSAPKLDANWLKRIQG